MRNGYLCGNTITNVEESQQGTCYDDSELCLWLVYMVAWTTPFRLTFSPYWCEHAHADSLARSLSQSRSNADLERHTERMYRASTQRLQTTHRHKGPRKVLKKTPSCRVCSTAPLATSSSSLVISSTITGSPQRESPAVQPNVPDIQTAAVESMPAGQETAREELKVAHNVASSSTACHCPRGKGRRLARPTRLVNMANGTSQPAVCSSPSPARRLPCLPLHGQVIVRPPAPGSLLLGSSVDVVRSIMDCLELPDLFFVSQTCRVLRAVALGDHTYWWQRVGHLSRHQRLRFWTGVAFVMPYHQVCESCARLHRFDPLLLARSIHRDCPWTTVSNAGHTIFHTTRLSSFYNIGLAHIQFALKCCRRRLVDPACLGALANLLAPQIEGKDNGVVRCKHKIQPKIVQGHFLHEDKWTLQSSHVNLDPHGLYQSQLSIPVCPHMILIPPIEVLIQLRPMGRGVMPKQLAAATSRACRNPGHYEKGGCPRCLLDFCVAYYPYDSGAGLPSIFTVTIWRDLGTEALSPADEQWHTQCFNHANLMETGPSIHHDPGSVYALYMGTPDTNLAPEHNTADDAGLSARMEAFASLDLGWPSTELG